MKTIKILSTKLLEPATKAIVDHSGMEITEHEFQSIIPCYEAETKHDVIEKVSMHRCFVFTSSNAVDVVATLLDEQKEKLVDKTIFALAGKTGLAVQNAFPGSKLVTKGRNATELAAMIIEEGISAICFFCGHSRRDELPSILMKAGIELSEVNVYTSEENSKQLNNAFDGVLFFSPGAVKSFFKKNQLHEASVCFAIGNTTASTLLEYTANEIITSPEPDPKKMMEQIIIHFNK